jgi:hypothetical protein
MSPLAVLTKLAAMLRNVPAVQFVFAKFAALLRNKESGEASGVIRSTVDQHAAVLQPSSDHAIAIPETNDQSEREKLIRRRWTETGIKMWNPDARCRTCSAKYSRTDRVAAAEVRRDPAWI